MTDSEVRKYKKSEGQQIKSNHKFIPIIWK